MSFDADESTLNDRQRKVLDLYHRLNAANRHKMEPVAVCIIPDALRQADGPPGH